MKMAFGEEEREKLLSEYERDKKEPSGWDKYWLKAVANQAGSEGRRAREILGR